MSTSTRVTAHKPRQFRLLSGRWPARVLADMTADLRAGALVIFPTETVYGIGTSVFAPQSIRRIYRLKGRRDRKPLAILAASLEAARPLVETIPPEAWLLAKRFCPGPLTMILKASPLGRLAMGGLATIGVRVPDHPLVLTLLKRVEVPLAATSVNRSGEAPALSGVSAARRMGRQVDWLIDGGRCRVRKASSVVDLSHYPFTVIREGAIPTNVLEETLKKR